MVINFSARSNSGLVRSNNEDNLYCNGVKMTEQSFSLDGSADVPCMFAVCDGMGGEDDGEIASLIAINTLHEHSRQIRLAALRGNVDEAVQSFISDADRKLCDLMRSSFTRCGTTLALVVISNNVVHAYNIGDSRIYTLNDKTLAQISDDHNLAGQKLKMGLITREQVRHDGGKHILTRYIGMQDDEIILMPDIITPFRFDSNKILICSDGLTDMLCDEHIHDILTAHEKISSAANILVEAAIQNGGCDNITCIILNSQREQIS